MDTGVLLTLVFGLFGVFVTIAGTGGSILLISLRAIRAVDERCDAKLDALRKELEARIEGVRIETKTDRHNYVDKIDGVLSEIRNDFLELSNTVSEGFGRLEAVSRLTRAERD